MTPILGVAPEHTRQLLLEGPVRVKEGREGKVRAGEKGEAGAEGRGMRGESQERGLVGKSICAIDLRTRRLTGG